MNAGTVEVRIRAAQDTTASYLTHWPVTDLNTLLRAVESWGFEYGGTTEGEVFGQFSVADESYFEIVVGVD